MTEDIVISCSGLQRNGNYFTKHAIENYFEKHKHETVTIKGQKGKLRLRTISEHTCIVFERILKEAQKDDT